jgi:hypothetical protein
MNAWIAAPAITVLATLGSPAVWAQQPSVTLSPAALKEIAEVEAEIDRIEAQTEKNTHMLPKFYSEVANDLEDITDVLPPIVLTVSLLAS